MLNGIAPGQLLTHLLTQRPLWRQYYQNTDVFIFMVDSNDRDRISESQDELQRAMAESELKDSILLVLANKQDLPNAMSVQEITEKLGLNNLKDRLWRKLPVKLVPIAGGTMDARSTVLLRSFYQ